MMEGDQPPTAGIDIDFRDYLHPDDTVHLPWTTGPSDQGCAVCAWCDRMIYAPALPCSVAPVDGLLRMETVPGLGARCQYELSTRR